MTDQPKAAPSTAGETPETDAYPTKLVERSIDEALNPKGMSTHGGWVKLRCDHVLHILAVSRSLERRLRVAEEERDFWKNTCIAERGKP